MSNEISSELILEEIRRNRQEIKTALESVEERILLKIEEQNQRIEKIENNYKKLADRIENIDRLQRENNLVIFGLQKKRQEINIDYIISEVKSLVDIDISSLDINNFYTLGNKENSPLKIEFVSYLKKASILKNTKKLRGTNISIANDMTVEERNEHKILRKHLHTAKQTKGNICYIKRNKLHINNQSYSAKQLAELEDTGEKIISPPLDAVPDIATKNTNLHLSGEKHPILQTESKNKETSETASNRKEVVRSETSEKAGKEDKVKTRSKKY